MNPVKKNNFNGLYVLGALYPHITGGMEIFNYYFLRHRLATLNKKDYYWTINELPGFKENHLKIAERKPIRFFYPWQLFWQLLRHRSKINYVYMGYGRQSWVLPYFYAVLFRLFKKPYIVTIHSGGKAYLKPEYFFRYFFKNAHALIGVSESICKEYGRMVPGKEIMYIPPLIPFERSAKSKAQLKAEFGVSPNDKVLLFVGTLKQMKNPDKVLQAFRLLGKEFIDNHRLKLVFAGGGEMLEQLRKESLEQGTGDHVFFPGLVNRESVPDLFAMADYYIISSDYEGTSVSLLEAMYNRLPIIGADSPGINKMLTHDDNGLLYPAHDREKLAECIRSVVEDPARATQMAEKGYAYFTGNYSYQSMIDKYEQLFNHFN